ncbi:type II toxin-antitoxin system Y4mF family antitoxin [Hephaestia sp. GCM10023244]|uniref:type II toxin-antitoxin system Y4mF family antitoxin n=1 Tax=unclassified Hephaestia TaxID=2631281 RepID=UPI0020770C5F|nr:type II toxin-antitoxin system Y4mF family antitoxin [Hephaestia sp. MAHUQ-44]MCM8730919.1 type II toxin-antitoxin system Y4mF family antitoxin [Hephaestia sp. MAHUQ-44]
MTTALTSPADLGAIIRATRKQQGLRQDELAGVAGVGIRFIIELEAGKQTMQVGKIMAVLAALGLTLAVESR